MSTKASLAGALAAAAAAVLAGSAFAADLPLAPPPPPVPIFTWTGVYLGGQIGYAWGNDKPNWAIGTPAAFFSDNFGNSAQGVIGGAHVGYNLQINQWVIGIEADVDGTSLSKTVLVPLTDGFGNTGTITATSRSSVQGSIRGRIGWAFDRVLVYGTGGVAFAGITNNFVDTTGLFTGFPGSNASFSNTRTGWTAGGGLEYAVTNNWSVRAEYRYSDFGHLSNFPFNAVLAPGFTFASQHHLTQNQVQVGFSYKFDNWATPPVVAKY
jgi:outer membrane immunogenic protein